MLLNLYSHNQWRLATGRSRSKQTKWPSRGIRWKCVSKAFVENSPLNVCHEVVSLHARRTPQSVITWRNWQLEVWSGTHFVAPLPFFQTLSMGSFPDGYMRWIQRIWETFHLACQVTFFGLFSSAMMPFEASEALVPSCLQFSNPFHHGPLRPPQFFTLKTSPSLSLNPPS